VSPKPDVSVERKNQILNAAQDVFTQKGIANARMEDIAVRTGVSKATLYLYFKSKEVLTAAILDRIFQREFDQIEDLQSAPSSALEAIWKFTDIATQDVKAALGIMPLAYEFIAMAFRNPFVQDTLRRYFDGYMDLLLPIVQRGIRTGEFRQVDAGEVVIAAGAIFEGTILGWVYDRSRVDPVKHIHSGMKLLFEGVLNRSA